MRIVTRAIQYPSLVADMISLVATRKRKDAHNPRTASHDKGKVRIIDRSSNGNAEPLVKAPHLRASLPSSRTFSNLRRGSFKIFSIFRGAKGMCHLWKHLRNSERDKAPGLAPRRRRRTAMAPIRILRITLSALMPPKLPC